MGYFLLLLKSTSYLCWVFTRHVREQQGRAVSLYALSLTPKHGLLDCWKHDVAFLMQVYEMFEAHPETERKKSQFFAWESFLGICGL